MIEPLSETDVRVLNDAWEHDFHEEENRCAGPARGPEALPWNDEESWYAQAQRCVREGWVTLTYKEGGPNEPEYGAYEIHSTELGRQILQRHKDGLPLEMFGVPMKPVKRSLDL